MSRNGSRRGDGRGYVPLPNNQEGTWPGQGYPHFGSFPQAYQHMITSTHQQSAQTYPMGVQPSVHNYPTGVRGLGPYLQQNASSHGQFNTVMQTHGADPRMPYGTQRSEVVSPYRPHGSPSRMLGAPFTRWTDGKSNMQQSEPARMSPGVFVDDGSRTY